jgi:hypothetical protein
MALERNEGHLDEEQGVMDEIDDLALLIPAPRRSPENVPVP